jgi:hypothetical protein
MMHLPASVSVYLCASACDMRKSFDGLHALVTQSMELDEVCLTSVQAQRRGRNVWDGPGLPSITHPGFTRVYSAHAAGAQQSETLAERSVALSAPDCPRRPRLSLRILRPGGPKRKRGAGAC